MKKSQITSKCPTCNGCGESPISEIHAEVVRAMIDVDDYTFTGSDISKKLRITPESASMRLLRMKQLGLVDSENRRGKKRWKLNRSSLTLKG